MSNFEFLIPEFKTLFEPAKGAEQLVYSDPRACCMRTRHALEQNADAEVPVSGMPNEQGEGFVDYVLSGANGKPLAVVEAKRSLKDPHVGQQQAKLYADCLEAEKGQRPLIFYSNGKHTWLWDDRRAPPREVQGFGDADANAMVAVIAAIKRSAAA